MMQRQRYCHDGVLLSFFLLAACWYHPALAFSSSWSSAGKRRQRTTSIRSALQHHHRDRASSGESKNAVIVWKDTTAADGEFLTSSSSQQHTLRYLYHVSKKKDRKSRDQLTSWATSSWSKMNGGDDIVFQKGCLLWANVTYQNLQAISSSLLEQQQKDDDDDEQYKSTSRNPNNKDNDSEEPSPFQLLSPLIQVDVSPQPDEDHCVRMSTYGGRCDGDDDDSQQGECQPFLWYRVESGWYGCNYVRRAPLQHPSLDVIPKIRSSDVEDYRDYLNTFDDTATRKISATIDNGGGQESKAPLFFQFWARRFAQAISTPQKSTTLSSSSTASTTYSLFLTEGLWQMTAGTFSHHTATEIVSQPYEAGYASFDNGSFAAFTMRPMSCSDSGRVKFWCKKANEKVLPPILLWWFSGLDTYIVLDGHDRLMAASLTQQDVIDVIYLSRRQKSKRLDEINPDAFDKIQAQAALLLDEQQERPPHEKTPPHVVRKMRRVNVQVANRLLLETHVPRLERVDSNNVVGIISVMDWKTEVSEELQSMDYDPDFNGDIFEGLPNE